MWKKNINKKINELLIIKKKKKTGEENVKVREEEEECVLISKYKVLNLFFMYSSFLLYYLT
jgi:hypothetical protein